MLPRASVIVDLVFGMGLVLTIMYLQIRLWPSSWFPQGPPVPSNRSEQTASDGPGSSGSSSDRLAVMWSEIRHEVE